MLIVIHRWQVNRNAYNNQKLQLEDSAENGGNCFFGAIFDKRMSSGMMWTEVSKRVSEMGLKNFTTQRVDRIEIDSAANEVHIYTSAVVERKHSPRGMCGICGKERKVPGSEVCAECGAEAIYGQGESANRNANRNECMFDCEFSEESAKYHAPECNCGKCKHSPDCPNFPRT